MTKFKYPIKGNNFLFAEWVKKYSNTYTELFKEARRNILSVLAIDRAELKRLAWDAARCHIRDKHHACLIWVDYLFKRGYVPYVRIKNIWDREFAMVKANKCTVMIYEQEEKDESVDSNEQKQER